MWLEPATEPVEESTQEVVYFEEKKKIKKEIQKTKIEVKSEDKLIQKEDVKLPEAENVQLSSNTIDSDLVSSRYNSPSSHLCNVFETILSAFFKDKSADFKNLDMTLI